MLSFISSGFTFIAIQVAEIFTPLLHVFHLHTSIPEAAALRRQDVYHLHYDVSSPEIGALLSNARYTYTRFQMEYVHQPKNTSIR
jgi:hypothetical protein